MKITREILTKLGFKKNGKIWTKWKFNLNENNTNNFSFNIGLIFFDIETVKDLHMLWKATKYENVMPLPLNKLKKQGKFIL